VRQRWEWLAGCSLVALVGIAWLFARLGAPASVWASIEIVGMILCAVVGLVTALASYPKKWPAGVALACAAPMAQNLLLGFPTTMELMLHVGVPYLLFLGGAIGAVAAAIAILVMQPPARPTDEIIARARVVR
jgi:hypothetical protein